ncbi:ParM/StbA family protein [Endozoicomonas lisbonensis]|uniref:Plasmid segregation protein ParM n=1 Tax=Endozoicomonas lisbonensis TaxID=3120522 RepID=A0ABV2SBL7_9GAMM
MTSLVVIDEGSAQAKATYRADNGAIVTHVVPSRVAEQAKVDINGYAESAYFTEEGGEYTVNGDFDDIIRTNIPSYQTSEANRALVHETLRQSGFGGRPVRVAVTLPMNQFFSKVQGAPINQKLIASKKRNVLGGIKSAAGHQLAEIIDCKVYPEGIPALFDTIRNDDGSLKSGFEEGMKILVVDIGGTTTDVSVVTPNGTIESYDSFSTGVLTVVERFSELAAPEFGLKRIPRALAEEAVKSGRLKNMNVSELIQRASRNVMQTILRELEAMVSTPSLLDKILIVGGGAALMGRELAEAMGVEVLIPEQPDMAISRGIYKLEMLKARS